MRARSGVYHVVIQSASSRVFFRDEEDYMQFVVTLDTKMRTDTEEEQGVRSCELYAYCLLPTHVHLLVKEGLEDISMIVKRIGSSYVHYLNRKYGVDGTLYKGRFRSEPVEDEQQMRELMGFVYENPLRHGMTKAWKYRMVKDEGFTVNGSRLMVNGDGGKFLEATEPEKAKPSDAQVWMLIGRLVGVGNRTDFLQLPDGTRREVLTKLRGQGASVRQLEKLTGVSRGIIQSLKK